MSLQLLYGQFCDHVKKQEKAFDEEFSSLIQTREMEMNEVNCHGLQHGIIDSIYVPRLVCVLVW